MPAISVLMKPSSGMCNMACEYCFYHDETRNRERESYGFMSVQTLRNVIRKTILRAEDAVCYAFQGGEPMLRGLDFYEKAIAYQKQYNKNRIQVQNAIQTNGLLINEDWCRFFKENNFLVGVSLDGIRETNDAYRHMAKDNAPTFDRICHSIGLLEKFEVEFNILTVVNRAVAENVEEIYSFYRRKKWNYQQYIACMDPLYETRGQSGFSLHPEAYGQFLIKLFRLWYKDWKKGRQPYIRQFENYIGILLGYIPEACDQRGTCGIQNVVEADGSVYPCDFYMLDEYRLGNFNENHLDEINEAREKSGFVDRSRRLDQACVSCRHYSLCRGGCQRNRDWNPEAGAYQNYFCRSYQMFFDACIDEMKEVAAFVLNKK